MKTRNRKYPQSSGMDRDKSGESERFYFPNASQISAIVGDHSQQMKTQICLIGDVGNRRWWIALITNPQIAGLQSPHHASFNFWRTFHFRPNSSGESERELWRLSDISGTVGKKWKPRLSGIFPTWKPGLKTVSWSRIARDVTFTWCLIYYSIICVQLLTSSFQSQALNERFQV